MSNFSYNIDSFISGPFRDYNEAISEFEDYKENNSWDGDLMLGSTLSGTKYYIFETKDVCDSGSDSVEISELTQEGQIFIQEVTEMVH